MDNLEKVLKGMHEKLENKAIFLPLVVTNAIIGYKLSHEDEVYWMNFARKASEYKIENMNDIYLFYIDFLPQTSQFEKSYKKKIDHMKEFHVFFEDFFYKQKFYFKNPEKFTKHLNKYSTGIPNPKVGEFTTNIFKIASEIRFKK